MFKICIFAWALKLKFKYDSLLKIDPYSFATLTQNFQKGRQKRDID